MSRISVFELVGKYAISFQDGETVKAAIKELLNKDGSAVIDFFNVEVAAPPFLNAAIGSLYENIENVRDVLSFEGTDSLMDRVIESVLVNSHRYYTEPAFREFVDNLSFDDEWEWEDEDE